MLLNKSVKTAFGGIVTALCVVLMFCTGLIPIATLALPALAGILLVSVVVELGKSWAWACFVAISLLSLMLAADKQAVVMFILYFGYYPILKAVLDCKRPKWLSWLLKYLVFNAAMIASYLVSMAFLGIEQEELGPFGVYAPWVMLAMGNVVFLLYDYALSLAVGLYFTKIHPAVGRLLRRK